MILIPSLLSGFLFSGEIYVFRLARKRRERLASAVIELAEKLYILEPARVHVSTQYFDRPIYHVTEVRIPL